MDFANIFGELSLSAVSLGGIHHALRSFAPRFTFSADRAEFKIR